MSSSAGLNFQATELCLGLPGAALGSCDDEEASTKSGGKRGFTEAVDLKLQLLVKEPAETGSKGNMAGYFTQDASKPPPKAQVVGWPPVRSYRKSMMEQKGDGAAFVKVCMDGAPYLRKVDLRMYKSYLELSDSLANMFASFTTGTNKRPSGMLDFMSDSKEINLINSSDYVATYEDKDGDWMLVGDVPWEMFVESCKRVRVMKASVAQCLGPKVVHRCQNR